MPQGKVRQFSFFQDSDSDSEEDVPVPIAAPPGSAGSSNSHAAQAATSADAAGTKMRSSAPALPRFQWLGGIEVPLTFRLLFDDKQFHAMCALGATGHPVQPVLCGEPVRCRGPFDAIGSRSTELCTGGREKCPPPLSRPLRTWPSCMGPRGTEGRPLPGRAATCQWFEAACIMRGSWRLPPPRITMQMYRPPSVHLATAQVHRSAARDATRRSGIRTRRRHRTRHRHRTRRRRRHRHHRRPCCWRRGRALHGARGTAEA